MSDGSARLLDNRKLVATKRLEMNAVCVGKVMGKRIEDQRRLVQSLLGIGVPKAFGGNPDGAVRVTEERILGAAAGALQSDGDLRDLGSVRHVRAGSSEVGRHLVPAGDNGPTGGEHRLERLFDGLLTVRDAARVFACWQQGAGGIQVTTRLS